ncbi:MAG: hypothetical protein AYK18_14505 [Theionarchaea archaeon DG-70]|nr:MAG: hypothetical protein AYK18_14505 [Theionarchaea archaeon DG-70]
MGEGELKLVSKGGETLFETYFPPFPMRGELDLTKKGVKVVIGFLTESTIQSSTVQFSLPCFFKASGHFGRILNQKLRTTVHVHSVRLCPVHRVRGELVLPPL